MNCSEANKMSIAGFLLSKGHTPDNHNEKSFLYCSPIRNEKTPSFKVDRVKNVWYDFGTGTGGRLIDLVCQMYNVDVSGALLIISGVSGTAQAPKSFSFDEQKQSGDSTIQIQHVQPLQNVALVNYIKSRGIPAGIAKNYVSEVYYKVYENQQKSYFAIGFKNDLGGFELRNGFKSEKYPNGFKGSSSPKTITTIEGNRNRVNVFEGFIDFLSALVIWGVPKSKTIVLNSVSHVKKLYENVAENTRFNLFLDNDKAGRNTANEIMSKYPGSVNQSINIYPDFKDFNELICKK